VPDLFLNVLKKFLTRRMEGENNTATPARRFKMIAKAVAFATRPSDHLLADLGGVALLFGLLFAGLHLAAI
jgi:hypothetical protein